MKKHLLWLLAILASPCMGQTSSTSQATPAAASSLVIANSLFLHGINITTGATAGYLMLFDATTVPADGTVAPALCIPIAATTGVVQHFSTPIYLRNGAAIAFSSTGCFTKTASATAYIAAMFR